MTTEEKQLKTAKETLSLEVKNLTELLETFDDLLGKPTKQSLMQSIRFLDVELLYIERVEDYNKEVYIKKDSDGTN